MMPLLPMISPALSIGHSSVSMITAVDAIADDDEDDEDDDRANEEMSPDSFLLHLNFRSMFRNSTLLAKFLQ